MTTLKNALGVPTGIDTDVNAAALAEYTMGAGKRRGSLLYVTVGTGIGGGLVIDGKGDGPRAGSSGNGAHDPCAAGRRYDARTASAHITDIVWKDWQAARQSRNAGDCRPS